MPVAKQDSKSVKFNKCSNLPHNDRIIAKEVPKLNCSKFLAKLEESGYYDVDNLHATDFVSTTDPECLKFFTWLTNNADKEEQFEFRSTDNDDELNRLNEECESLEMKCESVKKLNDTIEMKISSLQSTSKFDQSESKAVENHSKMAQIKYAKMCDELLSTLEILSENFLSIETSCRKIVHLCKDDETKMTETLRNIACKLNQNSDGESLRAKNVDDLSRLQVSFESLSGREIELKLKQCSQDCQLDRLKILDDDLFNLIPSPERLMAESSILQEKIKLLNTDLHNRVKTTQEFANCFAHDQILGVLQSDNEAAEIYCQYLIDQERSVANELKCQNCRLSQLKPFVDSIAEDLKEKTESFLAVEKFLKDKLANFEQFKRAFHHVKNIELDVNENGMHNSSTHIKNDDLKDSELRLKQASENTLQQLNSMHSYVNFATTFEQATLNTSCYLTSLETEMNSLEQSLSVFVAKVKQ